MKRASGPFLPACLVLGTLAGLAGCDPVCDLGPACRAPLELELSGAPADWAGLTLRVQVFAGETLAHEVEIPCVVSQGSCIADDPEVPLTFAVGPSDETGHASLAYFPEAFVPGPDTEYRVDIELADDGGVLATGTTSPTYEHDDRGEGCEDCHALVGALVLQTVEDD